MKKSKNLLKLIGTMGIVAPLPLISISCGVDNPNDKIPDTPRNTTEEFNYNIGMFIDWLDADNEYDYDNSWVSDSYVNAPYNTPIELTMVGDPKEWGHTKKGSILEKISKYNDKSKIEVGFESLRWKPKYKQEYKNYSIYDDGDIILSNVYTDKHKTSYNFEQFKDLLMNTEINSKISDEDYLKMIAYFQRIQNIIYNKFRHNDDNWSKLYTMSLKKSPNLLKDIIFSYEDNKLYKKLFSTYTPSDLNDLLDDIVDDSNKYNTKTNTLEFITSIVNNQKTKSLLEFEYDITTIPKGFSYFKSLSKQISLIDNENKTEDKYYNLSSFQFIQYNPKNHKIKITL